MPPFFSEQSSHESVPAVVQKDSDLTPEQPLSDALMRWLHEQSEAGVAPEQLGTAMVDAGWGAKAAQAALARLDSYRLELASGAAPGTEISPTNAGSGAQPGPDFSSSLPCFEVAGHVVGLLIHQQHPPLAVFSQLLTPSECKQLIDAARARLARSLTVETKTGGEEVNADRTSEGMFFERGESTLIQQIEARIAALLQWPVDHGEGLQILRYGPAAEYKPHYDYFDPAEPGTGAILRRGGQRIATLIIYLNTPEAGGATVFPQAGLDVMPQAGNAVFFRYAQPNPESRSLHGGAPVLAGEKWIATKWLRERHFE